MASDHHCHRVSDHDLPNIIMAMPVVTVLWSLGLDVGKRTQVVIVGLGMPAAMIT